MAHSMNKKVEAELRALPGNNICCDCEERNPQWASVSFGVFMCLECSGRHRALGVHVSFVRSVSMDSWTDKQIELMRAGGNNKCVSFLSSYDVAKTTPIPQKYNSAPALLYRDRLLAQVEGRPLPTELPVVSANSSTKSTGLHNSKNINPAEMSPDEQAAWIAEQQRLQEEAKERLRQKFGGSTGLSSSGKMAGIGSDPSYRPGAPAQSGISLPPIDVDIAEVSQKTLEFFSSTWSALSEQVVKSTQQLLQEGPGQGSNAAPGNEPRDGAGPAWAPNTEDINEQLGKTWSLLSSGAANLWSQATEVTAELVHSMTPNDPQNPHHIKGSDSYPTLPVNHSSSSMNSWDSMSDLNNNPSGEVHPVTMSARARQAPSTDSLKSSGRPVVKEKPQDDFFASFGV